MKTDPKTMEKAKFCKDKCPVCTRAREKGKGLLYQLVKFERKFCPYCRAYEEVFGKPAYK